MALREVPCHGPGSFVLRDYNNKPRTSGRLIRSGDLHSTTPKQNSTLRVITQIAIAILTNERWTTRPAHHQEETGFSHLQSMLLITYADGFASQAAFSRLLTLSLLKVINVKIPLQPHKNMTSHSMENLTFHSLLRSKIIILQILATSLIQLLFESLGEYSF